VPVGAGCVVGVVGTVVVSVTTSSVIATTSSSSAANTFEDTPPHKIQLIAIDRMVLLAMIHPKYRIL
jgi:ABC-type xylose transport system substrate-binding protein